MRAHFTLKLQISFVTDIFTNLETKKGDLVKGALYLNRTLSFLALFYLVFYLFVTNVCTLENQLSAFVTQA